MLVKRRHLSIFVHLSLAAVLSACGIFDGNKNKEENSNSSSNSSPLAALSLAEKAPEDLCCFGGKTIDKECML